MNLKEEIAKKNIKIENGQIKPKLENKKMTNILGDKDCWDYGIIAKGNFL